MPRGDRTGPTGMGEMTGRRAGFCAGFGMPGFENSAPRRGFGRGLVRERRAMNCRFGGGREWLDMLCATGLPRWMRPGGYSTAYRDQSSFQKIDPGTEKQMLKSRMDILQSELNSIEKRLIELEDETGEKKV